MGFLDRFRRGTATRMRKPAKDALRTGSTTVRASDRVDEEHLHAFVAERRGVEGFVEPRTAVSDVTLLLVAWAHDFANKHQVPSYDAAVVGIPQRMRDYNRRQKQLRKEQGGL
jgi:hypothetical protein